MPIGVLDNSLLFPSCHIGVAVCPCPNWLRPDIQFDSLKPYISLGGGDSNIFVCSPLLGEMIQFDYN